MGFITYNTSQTGESSNNTSVFITELSLLLTLLLITPWALLIIPSVTETLVLLDDSPVWLVL